MSDVAIELSDIKVRYGRKVAVDSVTMQIPKGSVYALLGRNGAGKSSLVRCLLGQLRPDHGVARILGEDAWKRRAQLMQRVAVVSEESDAPPEMSVAALSRFCASLYEKWDQESLEARLRTFDIPLNSRFGSLSKGQKKQVSLALALAMSPEVIVLDDPTLGLDVVARKSLFEEVIADLADRGTTMLVTTHDLAGIEMFADRVGILRNGQLVLDEEVEALKSRFRRIRFPIQPAALETVQLNAAQVKRWGNGSEAVVSNYDDLAYERLRGTAGFGASEVSAMTLEEIFIAVAGEKGESS